MSEESWTGRGWRVAVTDRDVQIHDDSGHTQVDRDDAYQLEVLRRWFRWRLYLDGEPLVRLRGMRSARAHALQSALLRAALEQPVRNAVAWRDTVRQTITTAHHDQRWIPTETVDRLLATRPEPGLIDLIQTADYASQLDEGELAAARFVDVDLQAPVAEANQQIMARELVDQRPFFESIEKTPLTEEQARAVVCFDNRVQVLAAAGSGKTSVMVARAAYAVSRGFVAPNRILLLAFNRAAATELQERITDRFAAAGIDSSGVRASTFHAFGLSLIGQATGEKPRLAPWLDHGQDIHTILQIVDELRDASDSFRYQWDLYRLLFANAPTDLEERIPDAYDPAARQTGYRTYGGEIVKSHGEKLIADFLYLNGVVYAYEQPYTVNLADADHGQYRPDFYYPEADVWHEHWAVARDGKPPADFHGYAVGMEWKRHVHATHGTTLVESTWADVMFSDGLSKLQNDLGRFGITFDWNPDRPPRTAWAKPMKHEDLARLVRTFMAHVKSNSWTRADLEARLASDLPRLSGYRTRLFLDVYWPIHDAWQRRLAEDGSVDFEDMLVQAAEHLEAGAATSPYELVLVDEFQDASRARARLVRGLVSSPGRYLLAVGDDWQSINRFAGADLSVMTRFDEWFGRGPQLALTTTFRCTQVICDVARGFVSRNPNQLDKPMHSAHQEDPGVPVTVILADDEADALSSYLQTLSASVESSRTPTGDMGTISVDVLGRYQFQRQSLPRSKPKNLHVTFRTVHGSKGLEADHVIVLGLTTGTYGFPSAITDDPVLDLAMPEPDTFPHAEERRLFYVALTRARHGVALITRTNQMSPFVTELLDNPHIITTGNGGRQVEVCPDCRRATLVDRNGKFGPFLGCSAFPACTYTRNPSKARAHQRRRDG